MECIRGSVLIVTDRLRGPVIEDVADACRAADMRPICWPAGDPRIAGGGHPSLLVGGLRPGERRIPPAMLTIADGAPNEPPLLLLCDEPLVRSTVALHDGRVTLVEQPTTRERLYSTVRMLLSSPGDADGYTVRAAAGLPLRARRRPHLWLGEIASSPLGPIVLDDTPRGIAAVVPFEPLDHAAPDAAIDAVLSARPLERTNEALADVLGTRAGLLHLDAHANEWAVWWPRTDAPLWVSSTRRLPNVFALHASGQTGLVRLRATHGDVAAALTLAPPLSELARIREVMTSGGPSLLDALAVHAPPSLTGCVLEVR